MPKILASALLGWSLAQFLLFALLVFDVNGAGRVILDAADADLALALLSVCLGGLQAIAFTATALCLNEPLSGPARRRL
jgi:hypothetical protein